MVTVTLKLLYKALSKRPPRPGDDVGYYDAPKRRGAPHVIEIDNREAQEEQEDTLGHELGHWLWKLFFPFVNDADREEAFAQELGRKISKLVRKYRRRP